MKKKNNSISPWIKFGKWILKLLDNVLTLPDVLFFVWYGLMRNGVKEKRKAEIKRSKNIKTGSTKILDFNSLLNMATKELDLHIQSVPFLVRLIPTAVLLAIVWITIIIVV